MEDTSHEELKPVHEELELSHEELQLRKRAVTRLKKRRDFRGHLFMYVAVNALLVVVWAITSDGTFFWPIFPILGWGIGLAANAYDVYWRKPISEDDIRREAERLRQW